MTRTILLLCLVHSLAGQSFEVASIKPHPGMVVRGGTFVSGNRVNFEAESIESLIAFAYNLKNYQISGDLDWVKSERWDVAARADGDGVLTRDQVRLMTRNLLADRCGLKFHHTTTELPVYLLMPAKGGPKLKESPPDANAILRLGGIQTIVITTTKGSMQQLADQLSANTDRPVLDQTGLTGDYDYKLEWAPDRPGAEDLNAPSIFAAVQEQLGLKLEPKKAPVEMLVIDQAAKPSEN